VTTGRIEAFSDGVFAIAITLLVLDLKVPEVDHGLGHALAQEWPRYASYATSFLTIGIIWVNHHAMFDRIVRVDRTLMFVNLLLLMLVSLIPFPTALLSRFLRSGPDQHVAAAVYSGTLLAMGITFFAVWLRASRGRRLIDAALPAPVVSAITRRNIVGQPIYLAALAAAFVSAAASLALCALGALYYVFPGRTIRS
jgi:uncharacterized membrane protein